QAVRAREDVDPTHAGVWGLMGSVAKEQEQWRVRVVDLPGEMSRAEVDWLSIPTDEQGNGWAYRDGQWYRQHWLPCAAETVGEKAFREGGVYVVIGGGGGLGEVLSEHLIERFDARMVWIGRREADVSLEAKLTRLGERETRPQYIRAD